MKTLYCLISQKTVLDETFDFVILFGKLLHKQKMMHLWNTYQKTTDNMV